MATLECLACGHDNDVGDESCSSCSSSLNLKLCSACEAINDNNAERCHSCNAQFRVEPEVVAFELDAPELRRLAEEAASSGKALPAVWRLATGQARKRSASSTAVLAVLALVVGGAAYYFYASSAAPAHPASAAATTKVGAAQKSEPQPRPEVSPPSEPARQQAAEPAPVPTVSTKIAPPKAAATHPRSAPPPEPNRTSASVTHTRAASAHAANRTVPVDTAIKTTTAADIAALPVVTVPAVPASEPAANGAIMPVSDSAAGRTSVTQTKADLTEPAITTTTTTPPAAAAQRTVPAEGRNDEPAGCVPAVVALGLCKSK